MQKSNFEMSQITARIDKQLDVYLKCFRYIAPYTIRNTGHNFISVQITKPIPPSSNEIDSQLDFKIDENTLLEGDLNMTIYEENPQINEYDLYQILN